MKRAFLISAVLILFSITSARAQQFAAGHLVQPHATPAAALSTLSGSYFPSQIQRISLVPSRLQWGYGSRVLYQLVYQPVEWDDPGCVRGMYPSPLPPIEETIYTPSDYERTVLINAWSARTFATHAEARSFFEQGLHRLQRGTGYILSTVASNSPYIVVYQEARTIAGPR